MAKPPDDQFEPDGAEDEVVREVEAIRAALQEQIGLVIEKYEDAYGLLPMLLAELAVTTQMTDYVLSVEQPSGSGLRRNLDRFQSDIEKLVRSFKKQADEHVAHMKQAMAEHEASEDAD